MHDHVNMYIYIYIFKDADDILNHHVLLLLSKLVYAPGPRYPWCGPPQAQLLPVLLDTTSTRRVITCSTS